MSINVAIVGYGYAGRVLHAPLIRIASGLNLYAVCTRSPERQQQAKADLSGIKVYSDYEDLLSDEKLDLVVLATPHDTHMPMAIKAMEAGKHVVVDKIMCLNVAEADAMISASRKYKRLLSVFHNRRWDGDFLTIKEIIKEGLLGEVFMVESAVMRYGAPGGWRRERKHGGGQILDWGAHLIDHALLLIPAPVKSVFCNFQYRIWGTDVENHCKCILEFANKCIYLIEISNIAKAQKPRWYILGELGGLIKYGLDPQEAALQRGEVGIAIQEPPENWSKVWTTIKGLEVELRIPTIPGRWTTYYQNISDAINEGKELLVKPEEVREAIKVIEAAINSAESGKAVELL